MLSFFWRRTICGRIRGQQIANYLEAQSNPTENFDVCIFVKKFPTKGRIRYFDLLDADRAVKHIKIHPEIKVIAVSKVLVEHLKNEIENDVVLIPQHHCNFKREQRPEREVKVAGWCGAKHAFEPYEKEIREGLKKAGIELRTMYVYKRRSDILKFYRDIDIQIAFREQSDWNKMFKNPLKLSNAGSFGIPTIAKPEINFMAEWEGDFIPAETVKQVVNVCWQLKCDAGLYREMADKARLKAEDYHIDNIAKLYRELDK